MQRIILPISSRYLTCLILHQVQVLVPLSQKPSLPIIVFFLPRQQYQNAQGGIILHVGDAVLASVSYNTWYGYQHPIIARFSPLSPRRETNGDT